ncbi:hypothetical protein GCM10009645_02320 [Mycolicibacterium poriferae]|uniref:Uncharacterized protein n=1 Tax=Mycolicibacterium poriferae TaxID=39694 RepID=A0A6N4V3L9_9MYCO|nr:hypothetical protein MPOR_04200 [Mycolicibacterium poriferae]
MVCCISSIAANAANDALLAWNTSVASAQAIVPAMTALININALSALIATPGNTAPTRRANRAARARITGPSSLSLSTIEP